MRVYVQNKPGCLIASLEGVANSFGDSLEGDCTLFRCIDEQLRRRRPKTLLIDFRDLTVIDGVTLKLLLAHSRRLATVLKVKLVGPGKALRQLREFLAVQPPVRFFPSLKAAMRTFASSIEPRSRQWTPFFRQFVETESDGLTVQDFRRQLQREFVVDLDEEAAYLRSEGDTPWTRSQPLTLEFRGPRQAVPTGAESFSRENEPRIFESG